MLFWFGFVVEERNGGGGGGGEKKGGGGGERRSLETRNKISCSSSPPCPLDPTSSS